MKVWTNTCEDCGTRGNICRDSDGVDRCRWCSKVRDDALVRCDCEMRYGTPPDGCDRPDEHLPKEAAATREP